MLKLQAQVRDKKANNQVLRDQDQIPAVIYGQGEEATAISIERGIFLKLYREAGESTIISLDLGTESTDVLVQDVQLDPVSHELLHIDFKKIKAGELITVAIPLEFVGEAPAEENGLGVVVKSLHEIEIEVMPQDLPSELEVDLSVLEDLSANIYVRDIKIPTGAEYVTDPNTVVASATEVTEEEESTEEAAEIDFSQIAVEQKGKGEDAEGGAEAQ